MKKILTFFIGCLLITNLAKSQNQSIKDYIDAYVGVNAKPYLQPLADLFASNINTNVWDWSSMDSKFYVRFKVQAMVSFPTAAMRTFEGKTTGDFEPMQTHSAPTVIGDENGIVIRGNDNSIYAFPGGYDLKQLTLGTPQVTIGGILHSEIAGRFLSFPLGGDLDRVRFFGIGGRHSLSAYFKNAPFDFSVGYIYHHIEAGDYLDSDQHLVSAHVGKSGKIFSGQLMVGYQTSDTDIHYTYVDGTDEYHVNLLMSNENPWIVEANAGLKLGPVYGSAAISVSPHLTAVLGAGVFF
jgi:hypothetical protein